MGWTAWAAGGAMSLTTGVATWWITRWRSRLDEKRRMKRQLLTELVANRYDLTGDRFSRALNAAAVVFAESPVVRGAVRNFHQEVSPQGPQPERVQDTLLAMIRVMFDDLGLQHGDLTDDFLLRPFNTRPSSALPPAAEHGGRPRRQ